MSKDCTIDNYESDNSNFGYLEVNNHSLGTSRHRDLTISDLKKEWLYAIQDLVGCAPWVINTVKVTIKLVPVYIHYLQLITRYKVFLIRYSHVPHTFAFTIFQMTSLTGLRMHYCKTQIVLGNLENIKFNFEPISCELAVYKFVETWIAEYFTNF